MKLTLRTRLIIGYAIILLSLLISAINGYQLLDTALKGKGVIRVHTEILILSETLLRSTLEIRAEMDQFLVNPTSNAPETILGKIDLLEQEALEFQKVIRGSINLEQQDTAQAIIDAVRVYKENFYYLKESFQRRGYNNLTGHNANLNILQSKLEKFLSNKDRLVLRLIKLQYQTLPLKANHNELKEKMRDIFMVLKLKYPGSTQQQMLREYQSNLDRLMFEVINIKDLIPLLHLNDEMIKMFADDNVQTARFTLNKQFKDSKKLGQQQRIFLIFISLSAILAGALSISILGMAPFALVKLSQEQAAILEAITDGLIAVNNKGVITLFNQSAKNILDMHDNYLGQSIKDILPDSRLPWTLSMKKAQYDREHQLGTTTVITTRIPIVIDGSIVGGIAVFREKGELTKLAGKLIQVNAYIDALRASNHEFKNRLQTIQGMIQLKKIDAVLKYIRTLHESHQLRISLYVDHIKDHAISAILLGKYNRAHEQGISLFLDSQSELKVVENAALQNGIVSILGNLIDNAMDSVLNNKIDEREITVVIRELKTSYYFSVQDNGPGIPEKLAKKIFEQGFSTKMVDTKKSDQIGINRDTHMGMGLYITKNYVLVLKGEIQFKSGQGTKFEVTLPKQ